MASDGEEGRGVAAKSFGKLLASVDPKISEWGNPLEQYSSIPA